MRTVFRRFHASLLESPGWKTFFSAVLPIAAAVLAGTFTVEITKDGALDWQHFYWAKSFYGLSTLSLVIYWYNRQLYLYERRVDRFLDDNYCRAYMRSQCLPEAAERYKELIRLGRGGELLEVMTEIERILQ